MYSATLYDEYDDVESGTTAMTMNDIWEWLKERGVDIQQIKCNEPQWEKENKKKDKSNEKD